MAFVSNARTLFPHFWTEFANAEANLNSLSGKITELPKKASLLNVYRFLSSDLFELQAHSHSVFTAEPSETYFFLKANIEYIELRSQAQNLHLGPISVSEITWQIRGKSKS